MQINDAYVAVRQGRGLAILGAGFSLGATNAKGIKLPKGNELAQRIMAVLKISEDADYGLAADLYRKSHPGDPTALTSYLADQFTVTSITDDQIKFGGLPWKRLYTTNYDNVAELASKAAAVDRLGLSTARPPEEHDRRTPWIVHLHGFVSDLNGPAAAQPFILSRTSYLDMELPKTKWPTQLQSDVASAGAVFIVGYSLADLHIASLLRLRPETKRKTFIVTQPNPAEALTSYASEFGTVLPIGLDGLMEAISAVDMSTVPDRGKRELLSFREVLLSDAPVAPTPDDIYNLLVSGRFDPRIHLNSVIDPSRPYSFTRNYALREIAKWNGEPRRFVISSRIGNGKSIFLKQLATHLSKSGLRVFEGLPPVDGYQEELEAIRIDPGPVAFLYEGIREYEDAIKAVSANLTAQDIILVAARPTAFATDYQNLHNLVGDGFRRLDLDTLTTADASDVDKLLSFYGLWGKSAGATTGARLKFIREQCAGETRSVVLHTFRSSSIGVRISEPLTRLTESQPAMLRVLAALLAVRLADCPLDFFDVCELMGVDPSLVRSSFKQSGVDDFFPEGENDLRGRSAILAEHILSNLLTSAVCLNALTDLVSQLVDYKDADWRYQDAIPRILRFAVVTRIFPRAERRPFITRLYEAILQTEYLRRNPQFWLQLAMARMEAEEWLLAEKALETAYQMAHAMPGYQTYMLDNQMIRFLLLSAVGGYATDISAAALKACELANSLFANMRGDIDIYVYRLVIPMLLLRNTFKSSMTPPATASVKATLTRLRERLDTVRRSRSLNEEEERVWKALRRS